MDAISKPSLPGLWRRCRGLAGAAALICLLPTDLQGQQSVGLEWDPNPPAEKVTGYTLYYGTTSRTDPAFTGYTFTNQVGGALDYRVLNLMEGVRYYFSVTAVNDYGESGFSEELIYPYDGSTPTNRAPSAEAATVAAVANSSQGITLGGSDLDGNALQFVVVSSVTHGRLDGTAPGLTYSPNPGFTGEDSFTFLVNDGFTNSALAKVVITVAEPGAADSIITPPDGGRNVAPVAKSATLSTPVNTSMAIRLTAVDDNKDTLSFQVVQPTTRGALTGKAPALTYTPEAGFTGVDSLLFRANDGKADSATAKITIYVENPGSYSQLRQTLEDTPLTLRLANAADPTYPAKFRILSGPAHGTIVGSLPDLVYTPATHYNGPDEFKFEVTTPSGRTLLASVNLTVLPVNDPPVAWEQTVTTGAGRTTGTITLQAQDVDGDPLTYEIQDKPTRGTLLGTPPLVRYEPSASFLTGEDSFTFVASDSLSRSAPARVRIQLVRPEDDNVAAPVKFVTNEDTPFPLVFACCPEGGTTVAQATTYPAHGRFVVVAGRMHYVPELDYSGADSFTYRLVRGNLLSESALVSLQINPVNDPPVLGSVSNLRLHSNQTSPKLLVTVRDADSSLASLSFAAQSSDPKVVAPEDISLRLNGSNLEVQFSTGSAGAGGSVITLNATDSEGATGSTTFAVTLETPTLRGSDFNGDGQNDLVLQQTLGFAAVWQMKGANLGSVALLDPVRPDSQEWRVVASADFNADGKPDLVYQHTDGRLVLWLMNGTHRISTGTIGPSGGVAAEWRVVAAPDLDGDLQPDLVFQRADGALAAWVRSGCDCVDASRLQPATPGGAEWRLVAATDFSGDGSDDLLFQHTDGTLGLWLMAGAKQTSVVFLEPSTPAVAGAKVVAAVDLDANNSPDLVFRNPDGRLAVWLMTGSARTGSGTLISPDSAMGFAPGMDALRQLVAPNDPRRGWEIVGPR